MNIQSIIILLIVLVLFVVVARWHFRGGNRKSCCRDRGGCEGCRGCSQC